MIVVYAGQANVLRLTMAAKSSGSPITAGTINFYLKAQTGTNAGKWYKSADGTWDSSEQTAGAATHSADGHWELSLASAVWTANVHYSLYGKESGDLHVPTDQDVLCFTALVSTSGGISRSAMKLHLKVDYTDDDDLIDQLILAATEWCQNFQNRIYVTTTKTDYLDSFPTTIRPRWSPLSSVTSIKYLDEDGVQQTLSSSLYRVDTNSEPGRITVAYNESWPTIREVTNTIEVEYEAGYGAAADVPDDVVAAIKLLVGHWYEHRESHTDGFQVKEVPMAVGALVAPYQWPEADT